MAKSSLYAAHRAAGAASGRYKASLYDIANVGYAMEADIGIEAIKGDANTVSLKEEAAKHGGKLDMKQMMRLSGHDV